MPYILPERRSNLDKQIKKILREIDSPGELNYVVCKLLDQLTLSVQKLRSYHSMSRWRAAVLDAAEEFYRRVMAPYEDTKREHNGEVFSYVERPRPASSPCANREDDESLDTWSCCICGRNSLRMVDGKAYCDRHAHVHDVYQAKYGARFDEVRSGKDGDNECQE